MKAITIKQPWLWCITDSTKRVENRTWKPPFDLIGQRIALHASKIASKAEWQAAMNTSIVSYIPTPGLMYSPQKVMPLGAIAATALLVGYVVVEQKPNTVERMVEASKNAMHYAHRQDPWFFGPVGWLLDDVKKLEQPISCTGKLGLWDVPTDVLTQMGVNNK